MICYRYIFIVSGILSAVKMAQALNWLVHLICMNSRGVTLSYPTGFTMGIVAKIVWRSLSVTSGRKLESRILGTLFDSGTPICSLRTIEVQRNTRKMFHRLTLTDRHFWNPSERLNPVADRCSCPSVRLAATMFSLFPLALFMQSEIPFLW